MKPIPTYLCLLLASLSNGAVAETKVVDPTKHVVSEQVKSAQKLKKDRQQRAIALLKLKKDYLDKVAAGKIDPLSSFKSSLPKLKKDLPTLQQNFKSYKEAKDPLRKQQIQSALLLALRPIGYFLNNAQHRKTDLTLTSTQVKEIKRLQLAQSSVALTEDKRQRGLRFSPLTAPFTLLDLPIPLTLHAPAETTIYLESSTGGRFANGIAFIELKTNKEGIASTYWVSHGDSVADNSIHAISSSGNAAHVVEIKDLSINFPAGLKNVLKTPTQKPTLKK